MRRSRLPYRIPYVEEARENRDPAKPPAGPAGESWEVRGGPWEACWVGAFYASVVVTVLATFGLLPWYVSLASISAVFLSITAIASSPTFLLLEKEGVALEKTRFFLARRRELPASEIRGLRVVESSRARGWDKNSTPERDISYFIRVDLLTGEGKVRAFRSALSAPPQANRDEALRVAGALAEATGLPVEHVFR